MKNLTVNRLALGNLKHRRKQYTIMIIGIILAMVFSSSIIYFAFSAYSTFKNIKDLDYGKADLIMMNMEDDKLNDLISSGAISKEYGTAHIVGYASGSGENENNGAYIAWLDDKGMELANPVLLEGAYPAKEGEIAIESTTLVRLGINAKVGDKITLDYAEMMGEEPAADINKKTYTLTGILRNKVANINEMEYSQTIPSAFVCKGTQTAVGGKENLCRYGFLKNNSALDDFYTSRKIDYGELISIGQRNLMNYSIGWDQMLAVAFYGIIAFVLALASCLAVINSFSSNLSQRKKQIGMLRAVGATKRQIIKIFGRETFIISLVCVPVSLLISYFAARSILKLMGDDYVANQNIGVLLICALFSVLVIIIASYIPLKSASRVTPMQAIRNIDSGRKMKSKHIKSKKEFAVPSLIAKRSLVFSKTRQIVVSVFLVISIIGSCFMVSYITYAKNEEHKLDSDYEMVLTQETLYYGINYKSENVGFSESVRQSVDGNQHIAKSCGQKWANAIWNLKDGYNEYIQFASCTADEIYSNDTYEKTVTADNYQDLLFSKISDEHLGLQKKVGIGDYCRMRLSSLDNEYVKMQSAYDGEINVDKLNAGQEIILIAPKNLVLAEFTENYGSRGGGIQTFTHVATEEYAKKNNAKIIASVECPYHAGDEIELSILTADKTDDNYDYEKSEFEFSNVDISKKNYKVKIGAIINEIDSSTHGYFNFFGSSFGFLTTNTGLNHFIEGQKYKEIYFWLDGKCTEEINSEVMETIKAGAQTVPHAYYSSNYEFNKEQRETMNKLMIVMYAVIILLFTICGSIINNALSSGIRDNKRQLGTLRAVGASEKELVSCYIKQLLSMFGWGTGIGFIGFVLAFIGLYCKQHFSNMHVLDWTPSFEFIFNPLPTVILVVLLFAICSFSLWSKICKEMKNSIVENIREL